MICYDMLRNDNDTCGMVLVVLVVLVVLQFGPSLVGHGLNVDHVGKYMLIKGRHFSCRAMQFMIEIVNTIAHALHSIVLGSDFVVDFQ